LFFVITASSSQSLLLSETQETPSVQTQPSTCSQSGHEKFSHLTHFPRKHPQFGGQSVPLEHSFPQSGRSVHLTKSAHPQPNNPGQLVQSLELQGSHCWV